MAKRYKTISKRCLLSRIKSHIKGLVKKNKGALTNNVRKYITESTKSGRTTMNGAPTQPITKTRTANTESKPSNLRKVRRNNSLFNSNLLKPGKALLMTKVGTAIANSKNLYA